MAAQRSRSSTLVFAAALAALYAAIMAAKLSLWHDNVLMSDWTFYNNSFWNTNFRDLWLFNHDHYVLFGYPSYLNEHFAPLLLVIAALYQIVPRPEVMLLLLHGASPVLAAIGVRATAIHVLGDRNLATLIALTFAFSPGILWPTISLIYGFQPDCILPPLAALAGWALATRRTGIYFLALVLALGVKENVPAYGVILGACLLIFTSWRVQAILTIVISLAVFVVASKGVPLFTGVQNRNVDVAWRFINRLVHLQPTFDYTWPEIVIGLAYSSVFVPAVFVWPFMVMIGPDLLLIGQVSYAKTVTWHVMLPVTVLALGSVWGTARILAIRRWPVWLDSRIDRSRLMHRYWAVGLAASTVAGSVTIWLAYDRYDALKSPVDRAAVADVIKEIPRDAGVATTSDLEQYFADRLVVSSRLEAIRRTPAAFSYLVVNRRVMTPARRNGPAAGVTRQDGCYIIAAEKLRQNGGQVVLDRGGILALHVAKAPPLQCP
jgi:Predicted membrane protein (DUF2079)